MVVLPCPLEDEETVEHPTSIFAISRGCNLPVSN